MSHYAKLGIDNIVTDVVVVDTIDCMDRGGNEIEEIGIEKLKSATGHETWKKCSYNMQRGVHKSGKTSFRANYPGIGWYYNSEYDIFYPPKPEGCDSWTLNYTTGVWDSPIAEPTLTAEQKSAMAYYVWDEAAYQADNTAGWVLVTP